MEDFLWRLHGRMMKRKQSKRFLSIFSLGKAALKLSVSWLTLLLWSTVLYGLLLPYQIYLVFRPKPGPGRPGGQPISRFFRKAFESKRAKRFIGAGLTVLIMFFGVMENTLAAKTELTDATLIMSPDTEVVTENTLEIPIKGVLAQGFHGFHRGIDILAPIGTEIRPIAGGKVVEVSLGRLGWGNTIVLEHEYGLRSRYAHMKEIRVIEGDQVAKEFVLGTVGMTGWTSGPHLHLELYQNGRAINPVSVLPMFASRLAQVR